MGAERASTYKNGVVEGKMVLVGAMSLYTPCAEDGSTRVMGSERWHHDLPKNMVSLQEALRDAW